MPSLCLPRPMICFGPFVDCVTIIPVASKHVLESETCLRDAVKSAKIEAHILAATQIDPYDRTLADERLGLASQVSNSLQVQIVESFNPIQHIDPVQSFCNYIRLSWIGDHFARDIVTEATVVKCSSLRKRNSFVSLRVKNQDRRFGLLHMPDSAATPCLHTIGLHSPWCTTSQLCSCRRDVRRHIQHIPIRNSTSANGGLKVEILLSHGEIAQELS